jgi:tripartite ATP-independent transporter DctP family solute receptor
MRARGRIERMGLLLVAGVAAAVGAVAPPAAGQATKIRFAHTVSTEDTSHKAIVEFAKKVKERTGGRVEVEIYPAAQLGNDPKVLEGVRLGTIDAGMTGNPFFTSFAPELNVLDLPYLFRDYDHVFKVLDGPLGRELLGHLDKHGLKGLGFLEIGFRNLTNSRRPVKTPADVKGLKIRVVPNPAHVQAWKLLGGIPTPMPFPEVYLALKTGTVDGQENPVTIIYSNKLYEVQKYLSLTWHAYTAFDVVMNLRKFQALPPDVQQVMAEALQEAFVWQRKLDREVEGDYLQRMKAAGVVVEEQPDRDAFAQVVASEVTEEYVKRFGTATLDRIRGTR